MECNQVFRQIARLSLFRRLMEVWPSSLDQHFRRRRGSQLHSSILYLSCFHLQLSLLLWGLVLPVLAGVSENKSSHPTTKKPIWIYLRSSGVEKLWSRHKVALASGVRCWGDLHRWGCDQNEDISPHVLFWSFHALIHCNHRPERTHGPPWGSQLHHPFEDPSF